MASEQGRPLWEVFAEEEKAVSKAVKCPHCGALAIQSNKYLYRCTDYSACGRYFDNEA